MLCRYILTIFFLLCGVLQLRGANIVCTSYPVWLLTRSVVQEASGISLTRLLPANAGCPHDYTPSPRDLRQAVKSGTILIANGMDLDNHVVQAVKKVNPKLHIIPALQADNVLDAHGFISPDTAVYMVKNIADALSSLDPSNQHIYQRNRRNICHKLNLLAAEYKASFQLEYAAMQSRVFINLAGLFRSCPIVVRENHNAVLSAGALSKLQQKILRARTRTIWLEKGSEDPAAKTLSKMCKLQPLELDTMLTGPENPPQDYWEKVMRSNLKKITGAAK